MKDRKILFAGVARDIASFIPTIRQNIEIYAQGFAAHGLILVESDSRDATRAALKSWTDAVNTQMPGRATLVALEPQTMAHPKRTDRIAACRNEYLRLMAESDFRDFDYLAVFDLDTPNTAPARADDFMAAIDFLEAHDDTAGVFANSMPLYYDIWALREKDWCPVDCWKEAVASGLEQRAAIQKYLHDRQIFIDPASAPIAVDSAFGGLGIYKIAKIAGATYAGLNPNGSEVCEHVAFHRQIRDAGGTLYILPFLLNVASIEHTTLPAGHDTMLLTANDRAIKLLAGKDHPLAAYRSKLPLYDERFPRLAALYSQHRDGSVLDIGANIGDGLALSRLHGCTSNYICVEGHEPYLMLLCTNAMMHHQLFEPCRKIGKFARFADGDVSVTAGAGTASLTARPGSAESATRFGDLPEFDDGDVGLIKLDTDGNDARILLRNMEYLARKRPVIWVEAEARDAAGLDSWLAAVEALSGLYCRVILFDNYGFAIAAGAMDELRSVLLSLLRYTFNHYNADPRAFGHAKINYLDVAFFAEGDEDLYQAFVATLGELRA